MAKRIALALIAGMLVLLGQEVSFAECGCGSEQSCCSSCGSHKHCKRCCCCSQPKESRQRGARFDSMVPRAGIVDSMPVFQLTPGVVSMPMMMASYNARSVEPQRAEKSCDSTSRDRLDELELQVQGLDKRMQVLQRSMEIQVRILEEMKAEGKFPQRYLPAAPQPQAQPQQPVQPQPQTPLPQAPQPQPEAQSQLQFRYQQ
jgi:hypothetical protein